MTVHRSPLALVAALALVALAGCATAIPGRALPLADAAAQQQAAPAPSAPAAASAAAQPSAAPGQPVKATPWPPATIPESARQDPQIVDSGFTAYDVEYSGKVISYAARVKNPNPSSWVASSVRMDVKFTDDAGKVIYDSDFEVIYTITPGATSAIGGTAVGGDLADVTAQPTKMVVTITDVRWFSTDDVAPGTISFGPATVKAGTRDSSVDSVLVSCDATSSYRSKLSSGSVAIVYLDQAGKIIGGNSDNSNLDHDSISLAGESVTKVEMEELFSLPSGVPAAACYPSFVGPI
jgi:hypothetical protein